ncbi:MAG: ferrous iron transport protein [Candidatus Sumerlaeota bacterium]|nr:ferrous iron transport protein [Candidatus Sumerlaeota bacterium]
MSTTIGAPGGNHEAPDLLGMVESARDGYGDALADDAMEAYYAEANKITSEVVDAQGRHQGLSFDRRLDRILTSRIWGFPAMILLLWGVLWLTVAGANVPSAMLATLTMEHGYNLLHAAANFLGAPGWLSGFLIDGVYLGAAWVFSVMLPPMAIFFPLFTMLEDFGYLPRVAFNLDRLFHKAGAHGKQALSMMMGLGCNAAGIVSTRIIDSPRERLIAILTNNFSICNGRWPTLILIGTIFLGALAPAGLGSLVAATSVVATCLLGVAFTFLVSAVLSRTVLRGETSTFSLELPPYRPPRIMQTLYTSLIDRTLLVLWRALIMAAPAGGIIWLISNITVADQSIAAHLIAFLSPAGWLLGLNGVILLAYVVAIPANEIIIPTILMLTLTIAIKDPSLAGMAQAGVMTEFADGNLVRRILTAGGWTTLTGINLMLFCLLHNPCSTTILTIWKETRSAKWTALATLLPLLLGIAVCATIAALVRLTS